MKPRRGVTIIELLVVMTIIGILTRFGAPKYGELRRQAQARAVAGDLQAVRIAVLNYNSDRNAWPPNAARGAMPATLDSYMPQGYQFVKKDYDLDYDTFSVVAIIGGTSTVVSVPALSVWTSDPVLQNAIATMARRGMPHIQFGDRTMFFINGFGA